MTRVIESLIDNCSHFELNQNQKAVLLGGCGIVVYFSRTVAYPSLRDLTITFEDENGASVHFHAWRAQRNELFVLRALVACGRAKATSRTAPWLKWLLGAGALALPDELARQVLGFWRPTE